LTLFGAAFNPFTCDIPLLFFLAFFTPTAFTFIGISPFMKTEFAPIHITFL